MATFPALTPSSRSFTPGRHPHSEIGTLNGLQTRVRTSNVVLEQRLRLTFLALTEAQMLSVRTHYLGQQGRFTSFAIPNALLSGMSTPASFTPTGYSWIYASQPKVTDVACGRHDVSVELVTIPPEGANINGAEFSINTNIAAGAATSTVNATGFALTNTCSLNAGGVYGDVEFVAPGAAITVAATFQAGTAEGTIVAQSQTAILYYTSTGSSLSISGAGFEPGFVATKRRNNSGTHAWFDHVRGTTKYVAAGQLVAETTDASSLTAFGSDGFTMGNSSTVNFSGTYLAWCLPKGGTPADNTSGTVTTSVSVQSGVEYSAFTYTGVGTTSKTIGHGLSGTPDLVIIKRRGVTDGPWIGGPLIGNNLYYDFSTTSATATSSSNVYQSFSSTLIFTGSTLQQNGITYAGWAFKAASGVSSIAEFTGGGSATHTVTLGYQPKLLILKSTSTTAGAWTLCYRPAGGTGYVTTVALNSNAAEATSTTVQFTSTGFSIDVGGPGNVSGGTTKSLYWAML